MDASPRDSLEPSAQGTFATTPLPHVLQHALERQLSGTFELSGRNGPAGTFLVVDGKPAKARTMVDHYLVRVMEQSGIMTPAQVHNWLPRLLMSEELHGQALLRQKVITQEQLEDGLRAQLFRQMQTIVELPADTTFKYYDLIDNLASWGGEATVSVEPVALIWASLKNQPPWLHVHPALDRLSQVAIRLKKDADLTKYGFDFGQRAAIDLVRRRPWRVEELLAAAPVPQEIAQLIVYCLMLTKQVDFVQASEEDEVLDAPVLEPAAKSSEKVPTPRVSGEEVRDSWLVQEWETEKATTPSHQIVTEMRAAVVEEVLPPSETPVSEPLPSTWNPAQESTPMPARTTPTYEVAGSPAAPWAVESRPTPAVFPSVSPPSSSTGNRLTARPPAPELPEAAFATPVPPRPVTDDPFLSSAPPPVRDDGPFSVSPSSRPAAAQEMTRTTLAPAPDYTEPGYDVKLPQLAPPTPPPSNPGAEVYTRSTVQRMNAVTAEEVAAYIKSQEKAARSASVGPPPSEPLGDVPRPATPPQFNPVGRGSLFRPPTPPTFTPGGKPNIPPPPYRLPRPPTPAMFPVSQTSPSMRAAIVPPEPAGKLPAPPGTPTTPITRPAQPAQNIPPPAAKPASPAVKVPFPVPRAPLPPMTRARHDPTAKTLVSAGVKPPDQVILVPGTKPATATTEGAAARLALGASAKATVDLGTREGTDERISSIAPLSARKTAEFAVDRALIDATVSPPSARETREVTPAPAPVAPEPTAPAGLSLDLDSPWDEGWDELVSSSKPGSTPPKK